MVKLLCRLPKCRGVDRKEETQDYPYLLLFRFLKKKGKL